MKNRTISDQNKKRLIYLSNLLKEYRHSEGLIQDDLCQHLHRNSVVRAENAKNLTLLSVFKLADALCISLNELFADIE